MKLFSLAVAIAIEKIVSLPANFSTMLHWQQTSNTYKQLASLFALISLALPNFAHKQVLFLKFI